jgi:predicted NBD/HSP70 family sugar kinase
VYAYQINRRVSWARDERSGGGLGGDDDHDYVLRGPAAAAERVCLSHHTNLRGPMTRADPQALRSAEVTADRRSPTVARPAVPSPPRPGNGRPPVGSSLVSTLLAGQFNRARVLKTLYAHGPLPRAELARLTGSTRATIGQIVHPLLAEGLLEEQDPLASGAQGGKPARPVWFSDEGWLIGAVCMLPDGARAALVSASGTVLTTSTVTFDAGAVDQAAIVDRVVTALNDVSAHATSLLRGIGIAVGGMVDTETGQVIRVSLAPSLDGLPIAPMVAEQTGVAAYVDLHPRAQALGDLWFGSGRGIPSFSSVYVGEGIGAGFIMDGVLHRGPGGAGGEVGHTRVDVHGARCHCGLVGCWETIAALPWLRAEARRRGLPRASEMTGRFLIRLADEGNEEAAELVELYGHNIAVGLANIQQALAPGLFVLHGDPPGGGERLRAVIQRELARGVYEHPAVEPCVVMADTDDYAVLRGAACIVLSRLLHVAF